MPFLSLPVVFPTRRMTALLALLMLSSASPAAPYAYITNQGDHSVSVIDLANDRVTATIPVARSPAGVVAVGRVGKVFVTAPDSNAVSVIDMRTQRVIDTLPAGQGAVGIDASADGRHIYVADWFGRHLLGFDTTTHQETLRVPLGVKRASDMLQNNANRCFVPDQVDAAPKPSFTVERGP